MRNWKVRYNLKHDTTCDVIFIKADIAVVIPKDGQTRLVEADGTLIELPQEIVSIEEVKAHSADVTIYPRQGDYSNTATFLKDHIEAVIENSFKADRLDEMKEEIIHENIERDEEKENEA